MSPLQPLAVTYHEQVRQGITTSSMRESYMPIDIHKSGGIMNNALQDNPEVIAPPPLIYAGPLAVGLLLSRVFPVKFLPRVAALSLGSLCIGIASMLIRSAIGEMRRANTSANPTRSVTALVTEGPFRYTRNPLYMSLTLLYAGIALIANAAWALLLLPVVLLIINRGVIDREERYLERKFGEQYLHYKARVRRWL
jgi:protein-S-isoprenylcysteine O-methyltransferase Ste14